MRGLGWQVVSGVATALAVPWRGVRFLARMPVRLGRLARMRAACEGVVPASTQFDGPVHTLGRPHVRLGEHCRLGRNVTLETSAEGRIVLGSNVWLNTGCVVVACSRMEVGDHTLIGEYVSIRDTNHGQAAGALIQEQGSVTESISIGRDVWIGRGAVVLPGVTIGDGAVVGANAVVTRDIPAGAIVAGVPARSLGQRGEAGGE